MKHGNPETEGIAQLCPACGLCCNGVLFADVELQARDSRKRLIELGFALEKKRGQEVFPQPCSCFDGRLCRAYHERPVRCRKFECGLLKRVQTGQLTAAAALKRISQVQQQVENIRRALRQLGNEEEHLPLSRRYATVAAQPLDLAGDDELLESRAALMLDVDRLMKVLHREFLTGE